MSNNILQKLSNIQNKISVPKNLYNKFGNYYYRNAETILESAKPVCAEEKTTLIISDEIVQVGERYYVKAIATLYDNESDGKIVNVAYAREEDNKKGMDASQVTGSTSSYARKYALNGLFNLDDVKDADSDEQQNELNAKKGNEEKPKQTELATPKQIEILRNNYQGENLNKLLQANKINKLEDMPKAKASEIISVLMELQKKKQGEKQNAN